VPIRVLLISNFRLLSESLAALIESQPQTFALVGVADSVARAREWIAKTPIDVVLFDIDSHTGTLGTLAPLITELHTSAQANILLLTRMDNHTQEDQAIVAGAHGLIDRDASPETLLNALQKINEGQIWLNRDATGRVFVELSRQGAKTAHEHSTDKATSLTEREQQIVAAIANNIGKPGKTIADALHISESTLRNHLTSIYDKLGVANRNGLLAYAFQNGLTE
jgi:two-component system, NarL family, nitrate/nitrite response regulator NarL